MTNGVYLSDDWQTLTDVIYGLVLARPWARHAQEGNDDEYADEEPRMELADRRLVRRRSKHGAGMTQPKYARPKPPVERILVDERWDVATKRNPHLAVIHIDRNGRDRVLAAFVNAKEAESYAMMVSIVRDIAKHRQ